LDLNLTPVKKLEKKRRQTVSKLREDSSPSFTKMKPVALLVIKFRI